MWYLAAILMVPDLVIGRLIQTLNATLANSLDEINKKSISSKEFFHRVDTSRVAFEKMSHVRPQPSSLILIMFIFIYISDFSEQYAGNYDNCTNLHRPGKLHFCIEAHKILNHLEQHGQCRLIYYHHPVPEEAGALNQSDLFLPKESQ